MRERNPISEKGVPFAAKVSKEFYKEKLTAEEKRAKPL